MAKIKKYGGFFFRIKNSLRKYAVLIFACIAVIFMLLGKAEVPVVENTKSFITDVTAPLVQLVSYPSQFLSYIIDTFNEMTSLWQENIRLREENKTLVEWRNYAQKLEGDLERIAQVVNYVHPPESFFITAKVIADGGTALSQSVIAFAGQLNGVKKGFVAITDEGVVGRVLYAGEKTSRIMLLSDIQSRLPVVVGDKKIRAMLAGNNTENPQILFLPIDAEVSVGDKILTSGEGGNFPPDLTVGVVNTVSEEGAVSAELAVNRNLLSFIKIVDFELEGILPEQDIKCKK